MKIAMLGTRGVPASYSGFETCVEQLGKRLASRGHDVTVYCRSHHIDYEGSIYEGMQLVKLPTVPNKYLDTIIHSFISSVHALPKRYDIALYFIAGNSPVTWIPRIVGTRTILNVDGLDWKRDKWPELAKRYIRFAEYLATKLPNAYLTDSHVVQTYYQERFNSLPPYIAYGSEVENLPPGDIMAKYGLEAGKYVLFVGRLVPENKVEHLVDAFRTLDTEDYKCVIVGGSAYADDYINDLKARAAGDDRIIFTGYVFGKGYHELGNNAAIFVETSSVGGTHPALTEAMAFASCCIVNDTDANLETIGNAGLSYSGKEGATALAPILDNLLQNPNEIARYSQLASARAQTVYSWESVTDAYEELFQQVLSK